MTIQKALELLHALQARHGQSILVFFDCPKCGIAYTPDIVVAEVIHIKAATAPKEPHG